MNQKQKIMLIEPTSKFSNAVLNSSHYLNDPKCILNHTIDCFYRQFHSNLDEAIKVVAGFLKKYEVANPKTQAANFIAWRKNIKMAEFNKLNTNSYIDNVPLYVEYKDKQINAWYEANITETWRYGHLVHKNEPLYPFGDL